MEMTDDVSDVEDFSSSSQAPMIIEKRENEKGDVSGSRDMLQEMQTRRFERIQEVKKESLSLLDSSRPPLAVQTTGEFKDGYDIDSTAQARPDVVQAPGSTRLSTGGNALNMSIREKMRNRMKNITSRSSTPDSLSGRKLRGLRERPLPSRFDEREQATLEDDLDPVLAQSMATMKEWKRLKNKGIKDAGFPTDEEAFKFFVGAMDADDEALIQPTVVKRESGKQLARKASKVPPIDSPSKLSAPPGANIDPVLGKEVEEDVVAKDEGDKDVEKGLLFDPTETTSLIHWGKMSYVTNQEQLALESSMYAYPSVIAASKQDKVEKGTVPRNKEDEGFYTGTPPRAPLRNLNAMENRLLLPEKVNYNWFDEDGNLKRLPDPLKEQPIRPAHVPDEELDPLLQLDWEKARVSTLDTRYIDDVGANHFQLDVDISSIHFTHHPLFSKEHILEARLIQLNEHFMARKKHGKLEIICHKLEALRLSLKQLEKTSNDKHIQSRREMLEEHTKRMNEYRVEIRKARSNKNEELLRDRLLLRNILKTWQSLKTIRQIQGFTNTPSSLKIHKVLSDKAEDEAKLQLDIEEEVSENRKIYEDEVDKLEEENRLQMASWKNYKKELKKYQKRMSQGDQDLGNPPEEVLKPGPLKDFDEQEERETIKQRLLGTLRKPGEPMLRPDLQTIATITPTEQCSRSEQIRRNAMKGCRYYIKVFFNNMEVHKTQPKGLNNDFTVHFGEIVNIQILQWIDSIKLQIYDASGLGSMMAELFLRVPEPSMVSGSVDLDAMEFSSDQHIQFNHDGVGSGYPVDLNIKQDPDGERPVIPLTSGILSTCSEWGVDASGKSLAPPKKQGQDNNIQNSNNRYDALAALGAAGMVDLQKLLAWICDAKLDPNDPQNADILSLAKMAQISQTEGISGPRYFRLNQLEEETQFATDEELDANKRFKLIKLRGMGVPEFKHYKLIPTHERYLPNNVFDALEQTAADEEDQDEISQRASVAKFLAKVRQEVHQRSQLTKHQYDLEDMIIEDVVPDIGTLGLQLAKLFEPRRPLKPVRRDRQKVGGQNLASVKDVNILINIVRAFGVPVRSEQNRSRPPPTRGSRFPGPGMASSTTGSMFSSSYPTQQRNEGGFNVAVAEHQSLVRPFIEVMFQGNFVRTSVADGSQPCWNEDLLLPFKSPSNDYSAEALQIVRDKIYINLFDEVIVDLLMDERHRETNIHQRIEKRWLGSIEIPFSTVYFNTMVEGFLHVNSPPVILGYQSSQASDSQALGHVGVGLVKAQTYLQVFITIQPQLQPAPLIADRFETRESESLQHRSKLWLAPLNAKFTDRNYKAMVSDLEGQKVFVTRYIRAQKPPNELILEDAIPEHQKMRLVARFVSLIPYIADSAQFPDLCDIWATSDQFLHMLAGDEEEHAVLLCNYFLWLGKRAWLVLGDGIPEGDTAYVLSMEGISYRLWNASTGEDYSVQDTRCPLQRIGCLVDESNIWANVQEFAHPSKVNFDLSKPKLWKPFFDKNYSNPGLSSVQLESLKYFPLDSQYAIDLGEKLERTIKEKIMEWRSMHITKFNRYCTQAFRTLLQQSEARLITGGYSPNDHSVELDQVLQSYKLTGFPLEMPFIDVSPIVERVYSTGVHHSEDPDVEFSLAVHVHPYPSSVLAVWIYVGRLTRKS